MQLSGFQTFDIPGAATAQSRPLSVAKGTAVPVRALVRNIGPSTLFLAGSQQDAVSPEGPSSKTFRLPPGTSEVFVLAPGQAMFCVSGAPGGIASVAWSEALPLL